MTQADRDRLVTLKKAKKKLITQREAAEELGVSTRHVKRLLHALKKRGDQAVIHGLRGKPSKRRIPEATEKEAVKTLSAEVYEDFGPTLAAEYLSKKHGIDASKGRLPSVSPKPREKNASGGPRSFSSSADEFRPAIP